VIFRVTTRKAEWENIHWTGRTEFPFTCQGRRITSNVSGSANPPSSRYRSHSCFTWIVEGSRKARFLPGERLPRVGDRLPRLRQVEDDPVHLPLVDPEVDVPHLHFVVPARAEVAPDGSSAALREIFPDLVRDHFSRGPTASSSLMVRAPHPIPASITVARGRRPPTSGSSPCPSDR